MSKKRNISWLFAANIDNWNKNLNEAEKNLNRFSRNIQGIGRTLSTSITAPLAAVGGGLLAATIKASNYADEIDKTAIRTGLAREQLEELRFVADQTGVSFASIQTAVTAFTRQLPAIENGSGEASKALQTMGISVRDSGGELRNMSSMFPEVLRSLRGMQNETERNAMALQIFGRGASELTPILNLSSQEFDRLSDRAHELGLVMGDESIRELVEFKDAMSEVKMQVEATGREFGMILLPIIKDELIPFIQDSAIPALRGLAERFKNLDEETKKNAITYAIYAAALGPIMIGTGKLIATLPALIKLVKMLNLALLANPYVLAAAGIAAITLKVVSLNKEFASSQKEIAKIKKEADSLLGGSVSIVGDQSELDTLSKRITDINKQIEQSQRAIQHGVQRGDVRLIRDMESRVMVLTKEREEVNRLMLESAQLIAVRVNQERSQQRLNTEQEKSVEITRNLAIENRRLIDGYQQIIELTDIIADDTINLDNNFTALADGIALLGMASNGASLSLNQAGEALRTVQQAISDTTDEDLRNELLLIEQRLQALIESMRTLEVESGGVGESLSSMAIDTRGLTSAMTEFAQITDDALQSAIFRAKSLSDILRTILKQLASRAITALIFGGITGGAGGGIFGSLFSGMFGGGNTTSVNDALIKSDGSVVKFHPDDNILAMKDFGKLGNINSGGDRTITVKLSGDFTARGSDLRKAINESIYIHDV